VIPIFQPHSQAEPGTGTEGAASEASEGTGRKAWAKLFRTMKQADDTDSEDETGAALAALTGASGILSAWSGSSSSSSAAVAALAPSSISFKRQPTERKAPSSITTYAADPQKGKAMEEAVQLVIGGAPLDEDARGAAGSSQAQPQPRQVTLTSLLSKPVLTPAALERMQQHPQFNAAVQAFASAMNEGGEGPKISATQIKNTLTEGGGLLGGLQALLLPPARKKAKTRKEGQDGRALNKAGEHKSLPKHLTSEERLELLKKKEAEDEQVAKAEAEHEAKRDPAVAYVRDCLRHAGVLIDNGKGKAGARPKVPTVAEMRAYIEKCGTRQSAFQAFKLAHKLHHNSAVRMEYYFDFIYGREQNHYTLVNKVTYPVYFTADDLLMRPRKAKAQQPLQQLPAPPT